MRLGVNLDHVATLRQLRGTPYPDLLWAADQAVSGGADQITVHLREDRRHIQPEDVIALKKRLSVPLNLEMSVAPAIVDFACKVRPTWACLVPEKRQEQTTEGGLDLVKHQKSVARAVHALQKKGIKVSLFIEPDARQIALAKTLGVEAVELHTGTYAIATQKQKPSESQVARELKRITRAIESAQGSELSVHAGHGLDYQNVRAIAELEIEELNIGHAIICRAMAHGLMLAVKHMVSAMRAP